MVLGRYGPKGMVPGGMTLPPTVNRQTHCLSATAFVGCYNSKFSCPIIYMILITIPFCSQTSRQCLIPPFANWDVIFDNCVCKYVLCCRYSIMLTKFMFIRSEYLFWYTCILPECVHAYIDDNMNCEDIAMQMLASGMTNQAPVAVQVCEAMN